jgi:hypothetical protein
MRSNLMWWVVPERASQEIAVRTVFGSHRSDLSMIGARSSRVPRRCSTQPHYMGLRHSRLTREKPALYSTSMVDTSEKSRPWWHRLITWLATKVAENLIAAAISLVSVVGVAAWLSGLLASIGKFLISERTVSGWVLGALDTAALGFGVATVALFFHNRRLRRALAVAMRWPTVAAKGERPAPFQPIQVDDERLNLRWYIRQRPELWLRYQDIQHSMSPQAIQDIVDGPYHAACLERLHEERAGYGANYSSPLLMTACPGCGMVLFSVPHRNLESVFVRSWTVRAQALQELQRMHRSGTAIEGPRLVLERPLYWKDMKPA